MKISERIGGTAMKTWARQRLLVIIAALISSSFAPEVTTNAAPAETTKTSLTEGKTRVVEFPSFCVGSLVYKIDATKDDPKKIIPLGKAQGRVLVESDKKLVLNGNFALLNNPQGLNALNADAIDGLVLEKIYADNEQPFSLGGLEKQKRLRLLSCDSTEFTPESIDVIARLKNLEELVLRGARVKSSKVPQLCRLNKLTNLDLSINELHDDAFKAIGTMQSLEVLALASTRMTDQSMREIAKLTHVRKLNLSTNKLTVSGFEQLRAMHSLEKLDISHIKLSPPAMQLISTLPLKRLEYATNDMSPQDKIAAQKIFARFELTDRSKIDNKKGLLLGPLR